MNLLKTIPNDLRRQFHSLRWTFAVIYTPVIAIFGVLVLVRVLTGIRTSHLTRDPLAILEAPFYIGAVSQLGILVWCAGVAVCGFTAAVLACRDTRHSITRFLVWSAALTAMLMLDDMFLLHEDAFPRLGIPERAVSVVYLVLSLWLLVCWQQIIRASDYLLLFVAPLLLGFSAGLDAIVKTEFPAYFIFEDGAKFAGMMSWSTYFATLCWRTLVEQRPNLTEQNTRAAVAPADTADARQLEPMAEAAP